MHNVEKCTAQKMKFFIKDYFSKCDQIRRKLPIWSHLLNKPLMENFTFCAEMAKHTLKLLRCEQSMFGDFSKYVWSLYMKGLTYFVPTFPYISIFRSSHWRCSIKKLFLTILHYLQKNTSAGVYFE